MTIELLPFADEQGEMAIYDLAGRKVASLFNGELRKDEQRSFRWDAGDLPNGIYFLNLKTANQVYNKKLVLQR